jgi:hypothetical protein
MTEHLGEAAMTPELRQRLSETIEGAALRASARATRHRRLADARRSVSVKVVRPASARIRRLLARRWMTHITRTWGKTLGRVSYKIWIVAVLAYTFVIPTTIFALLLPPALLLQLRAQTAIFGASDAGRISRRRELLSVGLVVAAFVGSTTLLGEWLEPGPLPRVSVQVSGVSTPTTGAFVGVTATGVYLGRNGQLVMIPQRLVDRVTVTAAPAQKPQKVRTSWQRLD